MKASLQLGLRARFVMLPRCHAGIAIDVRLARVLNWSMAFHSEDATISCLRVELQHTSDSSPGCLATTASCRRTRVGGRTSCRGTHLSREDRRTCTKLQWHQGRLHQSWPTVVSASSTNSKGDASGASLGTTRSHPVVTRRGACAAAAVGTSPSIAQRGAAPTTTGRICGTAHLLIALFTSGYASPTSFHRLWRRPCGSMGM